MTPAEIRTARAANHRARARDFTDAHGIPEAALLAAHVGPDIVHVAAAPDRLIPLAAALGEALALTRNDSAVQERQGRYCPHDPVTVAGDGIELHIRPAQWVHAFAVTERTAKSVKRSVQIFDAAGDAVHKIHLTDDSDVAAFADLVAALRLPDQPEALPFLPRATPIPDAPDPARTLRRLSPAAMTELLERAAAGGVSLAIRVTNPGCAQVFRGTVARILPAGYWINVMDPRFNLHLRTDHLATVLLTQAPDGLTVDAFGPTGEAILSVGAGPDASGWDALARGLTAETA